MKSMIRKSSGVFICMVLVFGMSLAVFATEGEALELESVVINSIVPAPTALIEQNEEAASEERVYYNVTLYYNTSWGGNYTLACDTTCVDSTDGFFIYAVHDVYVSKGYNSFKVTGFSYMIPPSKSGVAVDYKIQGPGGTTDLYAYFQL